MGPDSITILECPKCGAWYGSSSTPPECLQEEILHRREQDGTLATVGTRADCAHCGTPRELVRFVRVDALPRIAERVLADQRREEILMKEREKRRIEMLARGNGAHA